MSEFDVVVVGAGYGGATAAALLAHEGYRVALVEKNPRAGGKAATISRKGFEYEMWGAVGVPAEGSRFHELVDILGVADRVPFVIPQGNLAALHYRNPGGEWRKSLGPAKQADDPQAFERLKSVFGVTDDELVAMATMFAAILTLDDSDLDALDNVGMLEWMRGFDLPDPLLAQIGVSLNLLFVAPLDRLAASEAVYTLRQLVLGGAGRYHVGGYGKVAEVCAEYVVERGGTYVTSERVRRILVEGGRAVGIATADGEIRARAVVSNAGIQPTVLKLTGSEHFPADYVERVRSLEPSWAIAGVRYILDAPVFEAPIIVAFSDQSWLDDERFARAEAGDWPDVPAISIGVPNLLDPSLVPKPGYQVAITAVFTSADPSSPMSGEAIARSELLVDELWPDLRKHLVRKEPYGARHVSRMTRDAVVPGQGGEAIGLAQVVGQCGKSKPDARTPLPGLYLVGTDAGGRGSGTHQAVDSGINVAAMVHGDLG